MLDDNEAVQIKCGCRFCGRKTTVPLRDIKNSTGKFHCPFGCGQPVEYRRHDLLQLMNRTPTEGHFELTLYPVEICY